MHAVGEFGTSVLWHIACQSRPCRPVSRRRGIKRAGELVHKVRICIEILHRMKNPAILTQQRDELRFVPASDERFGGTSGQIIQPFPNRTPGRGDTWVKA
ncbi:MAG: hypothetical protein HW389_3781 [Bacteroidetes bacterium]|nr:hypothetical protein [Bacteroidota bacterium]